MERPDRGGRAGHYVRQPSGYRAFVPAPLPPMPPVHIGDELQSLLSKADRALGRLDGSIQTLPHPDLFVMMYVRKEAVLSSQIEGTQSSLQDVLEAEARVFTADAPSDVNEVINYVNAMNYGIGRLRDFPISIRLLREIHRLLLDGVRGDHLTPGELRLSQNWIGSGSCTLAEATFVPPPPELVAETLSQLERFLHTNVDYPLLIKIGLAHSQFETIHPFLDGNGRLGRLLITFLLCEQEVLIKPVLYLSHYFKAHRHAYYDHLQAVRDDGDWEGWLKFFLRGVFEVSQQATETARRILLLREDCQRAITDRFGKTAANGHRVLDQLFETPFISVKQVQSMTGVSFTAANALVKRFVDADIVGEATGQKRHRLFMFRRYVDIFHEQ